MKTEITSIVEGVYQISKIDERTGKVNDVIVEKADHILDPHQLGVVISQTVKGSLSRRAAFCSFLGLVYGHPRLDGFKGSADRATGKVSVEFKAAVRDVESAVVSDLVQAGHIKLPKTGNPEENLQAFLSQLRDDKNYSNVKVTTNKYFALVGVNCTTQSGFIVPVPVMQAQIAEVVERPTVDNSIAAKLKAIKEKMDSGTIAADDAIDSLHYAKELVSTLQGIVNHYAEAATAARGGVDVQANAILDKAAQVPVKQEKMPVGTRQRAKAEATA